MKRTHSMSHTDYRALWATIDLKFECIIHLIVFCVIWERFAFITAAGSVDELSRGREFKKNHRGLSFKILVKHRRCDSPFRPPKKTD